MYRNITSFIKDDQTYIRLDTWDDNGRPITKEIPHNPHLYVEPRHKHSGEEWKSIYNTHLKRVDFNNTFERSQYVKQYKGKLRIFDCLPSEQEFLIEQYAGQQEDHEFRKYDLRTHFLDIEVAVEDEFPLPSQAAYPINVMTIYDSHLKKYKCWICNKTEYKYKKYDDVEYHIFNSERKMLEHFVGWFSHNRPDVITGWNIDRFDIPYIVKRISKVTMMESELSPIYDVTTRAEQRRGESSSELIVKIKGITCLDYLYLYKNKFKSRNLPNYKLETVGQEELGYGKLEYEGTIKDFYKRNFKDFVDYNIQDVRLIVDLDNKLKYIDLVRVICNMGLCSLDSIYKSKPYIYGALILEAAQEQKKIITYDLRFNTEEGYDGAFVREPRVGIYRRGISSLDLNSLYPNIMIMLNISPESKIGKVIQENDTHVKIYIEKNNSTQVIEKSKFEELLKTKFTRSSNDILYIKPILHNDGSITKQGIIPKFLTRLYTERRATKNKMLKKSQEYEDAKKTNANIEDLDKIDRIKSSLDTTQMAFKLFLNSIYGQLGSKYFPMFDLDNAVAVTATGQSIIKGAMKYTDEYFKKKYGQEESIVYGDTDSVYFQIDGFVNELLGKETQFTDENINMMCNHLDENFVEDINVFCNHMTNNKFHSPLNRIEFKRETFCTEGMFIAKKRYVLHVRNDEGVSLNKFKYTGVEVKKTEHPDPIKGIMKYIIENSLEYNWNSKKFISEIQNQWERFKSLEHDDVALWKGYNTEKATAGFLHAEKGAGAYSKAAMFYNQLLNELGIRHKYDEIRVGDRMRFAYINKENSYGLDTIAWKDGSYPKEFEELFTIDYERMFRKAVLKPLKTAISINGWKHFDPADNETLDIMDL